MKPLSKRLRRYRRMADARLADFLELVWLTEEGQPIRMTEPTEIICDFLDEADRRGVHAVVLGSRGLGKSTITQGWVARRLGQNPARRIGICCDGKEAAIDRLTSIRHVIERNRRFRKLYPGLEIDRSGRGRRTLQKLRLTANPHAKDPSLRAAGILKGPIGARMDDLFGDDVCTEENSVKKPADRVSVIRAWLKTWRPFLIPTTGLYRYIGTPYHGEDLTHVLLATKTIAHLTVFLDPKTRDCYRVRRYWPGEEVEEWTIPLSDPRWPKRVYDELFEEMIASGDASSFLLSYCGVIVDPDTAPLRKDMFRHALTYTASRDFKDYKHRVVYADPASSKEKKACFYAGVVLGWDAKNRVSVVLDAWRIRAGLTARVKRYLEARDHWHPHVCAIEGKHEGAFGERIEEMALEDGKPIRLLRVHHGSEDEKIGRISSIGPLLDRGYLLADLRRWPFFGQEADSFPHGKMDALDALEGASALVQRWKRGNAVPKVFEIAKPEHVEAFTRKSPFGYRCRRPTRKERKGSTLSAASSLFGAR